MLCSAVTILSHTWLQQYRQASTNYYLRVIELSFLFYNGHIKIAKQQCANEEWLYGGKSCREVIFDHLQVNKHLCSHTDSNLHLENWKLRSRNPKANWNSTSVFFYCRTPSKICGTILDTQMSLNNLRRLSNIQKLTNNFRGHCRHANPN